MHEAQRYFDSLLELPLAENADLWLTVAEELLQLQHVEEVRQLDLVMLGLMYRTKTLLYITSIATVSQ